MSSEYILNLPKVGDIKVSKKRGQRSLRMRINSKGDVLVSVPFLTPKIAVEQFVSNRIIWILKNRPDYNLEFQHGMSFKSGITLGIYDYAPKNRSKFLANRLNIYVYGPYNPADQKQFKYIEKKLLEAMKIKAENELLPKLLKLSEEIDHEFNQAHIKHLQSRWGSCDSHKNIILNSYMLQLPEYLQRYIMLHELTHTKHMNHSNKFWQHMEQLMPEHATARKKLKNYQTRIE